MEEDSPLKSIFYFFVGCCLLNFLNPIFSFIPSTHFLAPTTTIETYSEPDQ